MAAPRPPKKGQGAGKAKAKAKAKTAPAPVVAVDAAGEGMAFEEDVSKPGLMEELQGIPVAETSLHPHRHVEDLIQDLETL